MFQRLMCNLVLRNQTEARKQLEKHVSNTKECQGIKRETLILQAIRCFSQTFVYFFISELLSLFVCHGVPRSWKFLFQVQ